MPSTMKEKRPKVKDTIVIFHYTKESTNSLKLPEKKACISKIPDGISLSSNTGKTVTAHF